MINSRYGSIQSLVFNLEGGQVIKPPAYSEQNSSEF